MTSDPCPNAAAHTDPNPGEPWPAYVARLGATHHQHACPRCGAWTIWTPRPTTAGTTEANTR